MNTHISNIPRPALQERMADILDVICPMHLMLNKTGHVIHVGPTLLKIKDKEEWIGKRFLELFSLKRPRSVTLAKDLNNILGAKLHLQMRASPFTKLKGVVVKSVQKEQFIVNLSFGISVVEAVRDFSLSNTDFAPTDLTIEMLYLVEAKSAAMEASRKLNLRLQGAMIEAEEQAFSDTLTGLKNRRALDYLLDRLLASSRSFALMQLDLDFFKAVNDTLGHAAGDFVLQTVAKLMNDETRDTDIVARVGGDEFVLIFPDMDQSSALEVIGNRLIKRLEVPIPFQGQNCQISASIGTVFRKTNSTVTADELMESADIALYASKRAGRGQQSFYRAELREQDWKQLEVSPQKNRQSDRE